MRKDDHDIYGISKYMQATTSVVSMALMQTGKTFKLIHSVNPGDQVVFSSQAHASLFQEKLYEERGIHIDAQVSPPDTSLDRLARFLPPKKKGATLHFDHVWIEEHYVKQVQKVTRSLSDFLNQMNTPGGSPIEWRSSEGACKFENVTIENSSSDGFRIDKT